MAIRTRGPRGDTTGLNSTPSSSWSTSYGAGETSLMPPAPTSTPTETRAPASTVSRQQQPQGYQEAYHTATPGAASSPSPSPIDVDRNARDAFSQLRDSGHDVKWQGNVLMVDGRPYELGDGQAAAPAAPFNYEGARDSWMGGGGPFASADEARAAAAQWAQEFGIPYDGGDTITLPNGGGQMDVVENFAGGAGNGRPMNRTWTPAGGNGPNPNGQAWAPSYAGQQQAFSAPAPTPRTAPWGERPTTYQPGEIGFDDIPEFTPESLQAQLANPKLDAYMSNLLDNPSTLDDHYTDTLKAKMKDTLAEQQQFEDQNLLGMGASYGISDSPWLASERAASTRSKNQAIASGAADIDIEAAKARQTDRLNVASQATAYQGQKGQQLLDTVNAGLNRAVATGNRMALRESVAQAAAASGQAAERLMADWIMQNAGIDLDYAQLSQQNRQFMEDLMYKMAALAQADAQFGAAFNQNENHWMYENGVQTPSYQERNS